MRLAGDAPRIEVLKMGERHPLMRACLLYLQM
jgi:hypothetical protein